MLVNQLELRVCTCTPGHRCQPCQEKGRAILRMMRLCRLEGSERHRFPVEYADQRTSMHDARAALCLATDVPLEHIHPCTGHNLGRLA